MEIAADTVPASPFDVWKKRWLRFLTYLRRAIPFAAGVAAAFLGLFAYYKINPGPEQMTMVQVNTAVAQAMASATPAPAYSSQVFRIIQPSLVLIQSKSQDANGKDQGKLGSGVVISDSAEILTALHVVENATDIQVTFADGTQSGAQIETTQPDQDIAVLIPDQPPNVLVPAVMGNPNAMRVGDEAYAVGNPFGLYGSMSAGVISGFNRSFHTEGSDQTIEGLIQIDTAVNPGNSGGPLLNRNGYVIGIVIGILNPTDNDFFVGIGFAVPITTAGGAAGAPQY